MNYWIMVSLFSLRGGFRIYLGVGRYKKAKKQTLGTKSENYE